MRIPTPGDRTKREAAERVAGLEAEAKNRVGRLEAELVQAKQRFDRAEQWLMLIRREIEGHLMPSVTAMHDRVWSKN